MTFAHAGDVRIRVHHLGGTGPPLVCVHATGFHGRVWEPFVPALREHFSVIAFDHRGHGDSDKPQTGYSWASFGDDALAVVTDLDLDRPVGIGHSAGAAALVLAETNRPGTFSRLVLMDPTALPAELRRLVRTAENPMSEQARRRRAIWDSPEEMIERLRVGTPLAGWREDFLHAYVTYGTQARDDGRIELKCSPDIEAQIYAAMPESDTWERIAELEPPTLLLTGASSHLWSGRSEMIAAQVRNGRGAVVDGGHFFPMENPDDTLALVVPFLTEGTG